MITRAQLMNEIQRMLAVFAADIQMNAKMNRLSADTASDELMATLLNLIYGYQLTRADANGTVHRGIDFFDDNANEGGGVAVQITCSNIRQKALKTKEAFINSDTSDRLCDCYETLVILILTMDEKFRNWEHITSDEFNIHILNLQDLINAMEHQDTEKLQTIHAYLSRELKINQDDREVIENIGEILDGNAIAEAKKSCTSEDIRKFYMVDTNFALMMRIVSADQDVPHPEIDEKLSSLCAAGTPAILAGDSGTGKSTIMLRAAVSWVRQGNLAVWIRFYDVPVFSGYTVKQFYAGLQQLLRPGQRALLCLDNPSDNVGAFRALAARWPGNDRIGLMMAERRNRFPELTRPSSDELHGWFDGACVVAMQPRSSTFRLKNYDTISIPDDNKRKATILQQTVSTLVAVGAVKPDRIHDTVQQIMEDYAGHNLSLVELIYRAQFRLRDFAHKPENLQMDWDEWKNFLRRKLRINKSPAILYGVIALCNLFEVPVSVDFFCRFFDIRSIDLREALHEEQFMRSNAAPVLVTPGTDTLRPKNDGAAELFFLFHKGTFNHDGLMIQIIEEMDEYEISDLLEKMVRKSPIRRGTKGILKSVRYRDYLIRIYQRIQRHQLNLNEEAKHRLALGLLYATTEADRTVTGSQTLEMLDSLDILADSTPLSASLFTEWGVLESRQGRKQAAEEKFSIVINNLPSHIPAHIEMGRLLARQPGRETEAEECLHRALLIAPHYIPSYLELGRLLARQPGREAEAENYLRKALQIDPSHIPARTELGRFLAKQPDRVAEAEKLLLDVIQIDPSHYNAHTELGRILAKQSGREAEAEKHLSQAIQINPEHIHGYMELGRLLAGQPGKEREAEVHLRHAIRLDPKNTACRLIWADILCRQGDFSYAERLLSESIRIDPGNIQARGKLDTLHNLMKRADSDTAPMIPDTPAEETFAEALGIRDAADPTVPDEDPHEAAAAEEEEEEQDELKIIFLGDGEAGKTLTIARLLHDGVIPEDFDGTTTPGIAISEMPYQIGEKTVKANIWDFGGQEILHSMHRMFLTGRTLYVILLNAREDNMDNRAKYWLQNLKSFAKESPAMLVINKIDGNIKAAVNEPELRKLYPQLNSIIKMSALNFTEDDFKQTFTNALYELISIFDSARTPFPPEWKELKKWIKTSLSDTIPNDVFRQRCLECGISDDPVIRHRILEMLRDDGICFFCGDAERDNHIILSPEWITNAVYMILFNDHPDLNNGILSRSSIDTLLCEKRKQPDPLYRILPDVVYQPQDVDYILSVIRAFSLSYPLESGDEFIPMLCERNTPAIVEEYYNNPNVLEFRIEYDYLPSNMVHNLMVRMQDQLATDIVWYSGAKFVEINTDCTSIVRNNGHTLEIYIRPEAKKALPFVYLRQLLEAIDKLDIDLSLACRKQIIAYKADNITQYFDYRHLVKGLARGTTRVYSEKHDKSVPVSLILNPNSSCDPDRQVLIEDIIGICRNLQRNRRYWIFDENGMNSYMRELLETKNYVVRDQTLAGTGATGAGDGELDLDVRKSTEANRHWTIVEAMWIKKNTSKEKWNKHLTKLMIDYNPIGLPFLIQVCYVKSTRNDFEKLSNSYLQHLQEYAPKNHIIHNSIPIETVPFGFEPNNLMFGAECTYVLDQGESIARTTVCHIFVFIEDTKS